jgi:hypothetical protein
MKAAINEGASPLVLAFLRELLATSVLLPAAYVSQRLKVSKVAAELSKRVTVLAHVPDTLLVKAKLSPIVAKHAASAAGSHRESQIASETPPSIEQVAAPVRIKFWPDAEDMGLFVALGAMMIYGVQLLSALALKHVTPLNYALLAVSWLMDGLLPDRIMRP